MHTQSLAPPTPTPRLAVHLKAALGCVLFLTLVPTFAQWQFSWMGFTPTDEGYVLMSSRRLLAGEVPHRDFISEKPVLSPLLHVPEVAWGGDYTFWISRYVVWVQFAVIGWAWAEMLTSLLLPDWACGTSPRSHCWDSYSAATPSHQSLGIRLMHCFFYRSGSCFVFASVDSTSWPIS